MRRTLLPLGVATVAALAFSGCGGGAATSTTASSTPAATKTSSPEVTIKAFQFAPKPLTVKAGTKVVFKNLDQIHHSVTAGTRAKPEKKQFDELLEAAPKAGASTQATITFATAGTYKYFCTFHPGDGMTGTVVVE